jgi:magnesium transporter
MVPTRLYSDGKLVKSDFPVAEISDHIAKKDCAVWADFLSPTAKDLADIEEELSLHPLAVEDAVHEHQRPKIDRYDTHQFLVAYSITFEGTTGGFEKAEIKAFITPNALITVHGPGFDMDKVVARWDANADLAKYGVGFLLWGLLDVIVDDHFDTVQQLDNAIESLEDALFDDRPRDKEVQRRSFEIRKSLVEVRRVIVPMREMLNTLMRRDVDEVDPAMIPYYQDVYDHILRATDSTDSLRDLVSTILDTNLSIQSNRMNLIMKKVTSWAAIIAVPTAITGFFGQNLRFAGFGTVWGVWLSIALILATSGALYISFKRRDWL